MKISQKVGLARMGTIYFSESLQFSLQENVKVIWGQVPLFEKMMDIFFNLDDADCSRNSILINWGDLNAITTKIILK